MFQGSADCIGNSSPQWVPRSSTLPRRPTRPLSAASLHAPEESNSSPVHRPRPHSRSPCRQPLEQNNSRNNSAYSNPYHNMAAQHLRRDVPHSGNDVLYANVVQYGQCNPVQAGLPPRPPSVQDAMHRRTLSASPRRLVNMAPQQAGHYHHGSPQRYARQLSRTLPPDVPPPQREDSNLYKHALSSSHNAVYDVHDKHHQSVRYQHNNSQSSQNITQAHHRSNTRQRHEESPTRKSHGHLHKSPYAHSSPSRFKKDQHINIILSDQPVVGNLSSSIDSGILPDQRSSNRDSSEDRYISASTSEDQSQLADSSEDHLIVEVTHENRNAVKHHLEVRSRPDERKSPGANKDRSRSSSQTQDKEKIEPSAFQSRNIASNRENIQKNEISSKTMNNRSNLSNKLTSGNNKNSCNRSASITAGGNKTKTYTANGDISKRYNRAALQLDLVSSHNMSPRKNSVPPTSSKSHQETNNKFTKSFSKDLTSKNVSCKDTNKCDKKLYVPHNSVGTRNSKSATSKLSAKQVLSPTKKKANRSKLESKSTDKKISSQSEEPKKQEEENNQTEVLLSSSEVETAEKSLKDCPKKPVVSVTE